MAMITLRKALVKKNQLKGRVSELRGLIGRKNSHRSDAAHTSMVDVRAAMEELDATVVKLIQLKTEISKANVGIYHTLACLEETKAKIEWIGGLDTFEGAKPASVFGVSGEQQPLTYVAQLKEDELRSMKAGLQKTVEELLERVDEFNSTTMIEAGFLD